MVELWAAAPWLVVLYWLLGEVCALANGRSFSTCSLKRWVSWYTVISFYLIIAWTGTSKKVVLSGAALRWKMQWEASCNIGASNAYFLFLSKWVEYAFSLHVFLGESHNPHRDLSTFALGLPANGKRQLFTWQVATGGTEQTKTVPARYGGCYSSSING